MNLNDELIRDISKNKVIDQSHFCHLGWEGTGPFAFIKYADAYFDSAEILFDKFKESAGDYAVLDGIGITICFLYRHSVELYIKYLYLSLACKSEDEFKSFLKKGHNLLDLWSALKPRLSEMKKIVGRLLILEFLNIILWNFIVLMRNL